MTSPAADAVPTAIAVLGPEAESERWARALRGVEGVTAACPDGGDDAGQPSPAAGLMAAVSRDDVDAIAFAGPVTDLAGAIKRALMAGRHVLAATSGAISERQLLALEVQARRRNRVLMFDTGTIGDERIDFVRRMTSGPQALWQPRYVRSLRTGTTDVASLDEIAIADISFVCSLLGGAPTRVSAVSPRSDDDGGAPDVVLATLTFEGGAVARIDVSRIEPEPRHEVAIACDGRTILLDAYDARAPMRIESGARARGPRPDGWGETVSEHPATEAADRLARAASTFAAAIRGRDLAASNARPLAVATAVWEAARKSIAAGGEMIDLSPAAQQRRPALKLIVGGGHVDTSHPAPDLKLVARRPAPPRDDPPEPLRSA